MSKLAEHIQKLDGHLKRFRESGIANLIDGKDVRSVGTFETRSPVDESLICDVSKGNAGDIDLAAKAAKAAFPAWAAMSGDARKKILHKIADLIVERAEEIALCECWDTGQAIGLCRRLLCAALKTSAILLICAVRPRWAIAANCATYECHLA